MPEGLALLLIFLGVFSWRIAMHFVDVRRIRALATSKGWRDVAVVWQPFAPGWLGERSRRQYQVFYLDADGETREVFAATSLFADVYWRDGDTDALPG